jgi:hypothetical protein
MLKVYEAGHEAERQVWTKGWIKGEGQRQVQLQVTRTIWISGHLDSWWQGEPWEVKSQSASEWRPIRESPLWDQYAWQISVYMLATGRSLNLIRVLRDVDGNVSDSQVERFDESPHTIEDIRRRVFDIEGLARKDLTSVSCERLQFPCPFFYTHMSSDDTLVREVLDDDGALKLAEDYKHAQVEKVAVEGRLKSARTALLTFMGDHDKLDVNGWKLTRYNVPEKHIEYDRKEYQALRVTEPKKNETREDGDDGEEKGAAGV